MPSSPDPFFITGSSWYYNNGLVFPATMSGENRIYRIGDISTTNNNELPV
jgi:hypothetical protein